MQKPLKVLMHSNAAHSPSGYGNQTDIVTRWLKAHGHEPIISAFHGLTGATFNHNGIETLPGGQEQWGNDMIAAHYAHYRPDVLMCLMDAWVILDKVLDSVPAAVWTPIDHEPIPPAVAAKLPHIRWPVAMSRHGEREMRVNGADPFYVPHMVETDVYTPIDRQQARANWGIEEGRYFVATVAANKGFPPRKNLDRLLKAWSHFLDEHPGGVLYLHTMPYATQGGLSMPDLCHFYGLRYHDGAVKSADELRNVDVICPDVYRMLRGDYGALALNNLHNAADLFILPSMGGGFEIPLIEAQSAGCPVATTAFTAMEELSVAGYQIPIDRVNDLTYTLQMSHQCLPKVSEIVTAFEWGLHFQGDDSLRARAREFALGYDAETVMTKHMLPAMQIMAQGNADGANQARAA